MEVGSCSSMAHYYLLQKLGYDYIELSGKTIAAMGESQFQEVADTVRQGSMYCNGFNDYCPPEIVIAGPRYDLEAAIAYGERLCRRGRQLGIETIGIGAPLSRILPPGFDENLAYRQALDFLEATASLAGSYGITILWEACNHQVCNFVNRVTEAIDMVEKLNIKNLKVVADLYHMEIMGEPAALLKDALEWIAHIHVAETDETGTRGFLTEKTYPRHREAIGELVQAGYRGRVSVEPAPQAHISGAEKNIEILRRIQRELFL